MADPKNVIVTGGGGKIGNHVVTALLDRGHAVVNFDCRKQRDARATFVYGNVRNRAEVAGAMRGCDVVCHLAEIAGPRVPVAVDEVYWGNCRAASVVMQSAMDLKLSRIIYTSSCQVYGCWEAAAAPDRLPMDETHPLRPRNAYALSKVANEAYAELVYRESGMPISIFRFPGVLIDEYLTREMIRGVMGDDGWTDGFETYVHARDAASAYVAAIEADRPGVEAYNLVADEVASGFPIRQRLIKHHPDYPRLPEDWPDFKSPVSSQKAWDQLHWKAAWNFRQHAAGIL